MKVATIYYSITTTNTNGEVSEPFPSNEGRYKNKQGELKCSNQLVSEPFPSNEGRYLT